MLYVVIYLALFEIGSSLNAVSENVIWIEFGLLRVMLEKNLTFCILEYFYFRICF